MIVKARVFKSINMEGQAIKHFVYATFENGVLIWTYKRIWLSDEPKYGEVVRKFWNKYLMLESILFKDESLINFWSCCIDIQKAIHNKNYFK